ncbi:stage III sporulation protein AA [Ruminococcus albus]|uniref:Stage III sporulation protein AA n=1 Tax=Ruminococcus albus TaxID=1264 RepID=A0A1I1E9D8_RUMAL|nr:stage III sporulation protein AA [Ruminococcus albus]SFB81583.1 stage III sporulation protein AA [Ruminococcus albus]
MHQNSGLENALKLLPTDLAEMLEKLPWDITKKVCEIRLRTGRPLALTLTDATIIPNLEIKVTPKDIELIAARAFRYSMHSSTAQLCEGYAAWCGGMRVGISGTAAEEGGKVVNVRDISSLNIRIPREVTGCAEDIFRRLMTVHPISLLIAGEPSSGKTTFLRDLARLCGGIYRTAIIDERSELAATVSGIPTNDVGIMTDIFDRYPRKTAIEMAVRVMSPQVLICDEIGSADDISSLEYACDSGVALIATCHCGSLSELSYKPNISKVLEEGVFDTVMLLKDRAVKDIRTAGELLCLA